MSTAVLVPGLVRRHVAMLRAVDAGRAEITTSRSPDLYVDGRCCTDHAATVLLATAGLVTTTTSPSGPCARVPACLTDAGRAALAAALMSRPARPDAWQQNPWRVGVPSTHVMSE